MSRCEELSSLEVEFTVVSVVVALPAHAALDSVLRYRSPGPLQAGSWVRVPLGSRTVLGVVWDGMPPSPASDVALRDVAETLPAFPPLDSHWRQMMAFAARYYQRSLGELVMTALPPQMRELTQTQWERRWRKWCKAATKPEAQRDGQAEGSGPDAVPAPSPQQAMALSALQNAAEPWRPILLHGVTGSGKTEVYLQRVAECLATDSNAQALILVPEINLTPQLQARFTARFAVQWGPQAVVALHSGLTPAQRFDAWLAGHLGRARIVLGTRTAVLCSLPHLRMVVVDEEHDPSYKSQEGARFSARDLAIYRAHALQQSGQTCQVILGSATPSLESWHAALEGRYRRIDLTARQGNGQPAAVRLVDMARQPRGAVLAPMLLEALQDRVARGEQVLLLLNRRGYAPVLSCGGCGWKSHCPQCSAYRVFHKVDRTLRCHHCGQSNRVPRACPECGNLDIQPVGQGTQQLEEQVTALLSHVRRPDGQALRVARMDADTTRASGSLEAQLEQVHSGQVNVLVGTQMVAKGHDFRRITLVGVLNADSALFAADYRAPERLFSLLMQAAGRAGRDAALSAHSELWVQTWNPTHPLFEALVRHDFEGFAGRELAERQAAALPPFSHQALLRAEARTAEAAQGFLNRVRLVLQTDDRSENPVTTYPPISPPVQRVANVERAQMLMESTSRPALHRLLGRLSDIAHETRRHPDAKGLIRWAIDVDPISI